MNKPKILCPRCGHPILAKGGHQTNRASRDGECSYCRECHEARVARIGTGA